MKASEGGRQGGGAALRWVDAPLRELLALAAPIAASMVSYSLMTLVDTLFVAGLGPSALAAVGLGGITSFTLVCLPFGVMGGVRILVSQADGGGRRDQAGAFLGAGLLLAAGLGLLAALAGQLAALAMPLASATAAAGEGAAAYVAIRAFGAPFHVVFAALREHRHGLGQTRLPMVATVVANVVNVALDWLMIVVLGLGVEGAAWATVAATAVQPLVMLAGGPLGLRRPTARQVRAVWRLGAPSGLQFVLEVGAFEAVALMIAAYGERDMAAHHIAVQVIHFGFLPIVALGDAVSVLAGQAVGAGRQGEVRTAARAALVAGGSYAGLCTAVFALFAPLIVRGFTADSDLAALATRLLYVAAVFQIFDAANMVARGTLRGAGDVQYTAVLGIILSWASTPPLTWLLAYGLDLGALGGWLALCGEIGLGAALFWRRLLGRGWHEAAERSRAEAMAGGAEA